MKTKHTISLEDLEGCEMIQTIASDGSGKRLMLRVSPLLNDVRYIFTRGDDRKSFDFQDTEKAIDYYNEH